MHIGGIGGSLFFYIAMAIAKSNRPRGTTRREAGKEADMAQKSDVGETLVLAVEKIWSFLSPFVLPFLDEKDLVPTVALSLVCLAAIMAWAYWGKLLVFAGPRNDKWISKIGVLVSLPLVAILGYLFFWKVLGFCWGLVPAPFGWQWLKSAIGWLIKLGAPIAIMIAIIKAIFFSPLATAGKAVSLAKGAKDYVVKGWAHAELAPAFTFLGALGLNYVVHYDKWSNKDTYYASSVIMGLLGFVAVVQKVMEHLQTREPAPELEAEPEEEAREAPSLPEPVVEEPPPPPSDEPFDVELAGTPCRKPVCPGLLADGENFCGTCATSRVAPERPISVRETPARRSKRTRKRPASPLLKYKL